MANTIQIRRGIHASLPALAAGELGFSTDTFQVNIGNGGTNYEFVMHQLFGAQTVLAATSDNTPVALTVTEQTLVGRLTGGDVSAVGMGIADNNIVQIDDADAANLDYAKFTAAGLEGRSYAEVMADLSGQAGADFAMNTNKITGITDPTLDQDAATKAYVDSVASGLDIKASCTLATAAALTACTSSGSGVGKTLTGDSAAVLTIDSVATVLNDRILVQDQSTGADNGIYDVTTEGTSGVAFVLTRSTDADEDVEVTAGMFTFIEEGTINGDKGFVLTTNDPITVDTTALVFSQFSSAGAGATTFVELTDTPANYSGVGSYALRVNAGATAVEFVDFATAYLETTPTNGVANKAADSNWSFDHDAAATGVHGAGANTILHSASTIDGGTWA